MTTQFPTLAAAAPAPKKPYKYTHLLRYPGDPITRQRFEFTGLALKVREFLSYQVGTTTRDEAARMLWVQGRPGEGKSEGCLVSALNSGFTTAILSPGMFSGESENASIEVLHEVLAEIERWSTEQKRRVVCQIDDIDLSIMAVGENTGHTVNSQLLINEFMALADNRHLYRNGDGSNIGFIMTVNDATGMRESLHRPGRAIWHDHVPSTEDKTNIAYAILAPVNSAERDLVKTLVRKYAASQPVAFWKALYHRMQALKAQSLMSADMPDKTAIDRAYGRRLTLEPDIAWAAAKALRQSKVRNYLNRRRGFFRR